MSLVKRKNDPWFPSIFDDFFTPNLFGEVINRKEVGVSVPAVNIKETSENFHVELAVPGKKKEDFNIEVENDMLTISSEDKKEHEEKDKEGRYTRREFSYSSFKRAFTLPDNVNAGAIDAKYEDGVLKINLPKKDVSVSGPKRSIEIS
ncbi:MAG: Hsp20/alpha crystallin family protein [Sinomicrobium sp.]|nr:Hsp20/alpha crystallin family protein [Sinomicrobium sp.]